MELIFSCHSISVTAVAATSTAGPAAAAGVPCLALWSVCSPSARAADDHPAAMTSAMTAPASRPATSCDARRPVI
jgi:hypothetical protein